MRNLTDAVTSKRNLLSVLVAAAAVFTFANHALAQGFSVGVTVDENGNGTLTNSQGGQSVLTATVGLDPGPGGLANALIYNLQNPPGLVAGDLLMFEPGVSNVLSDVIRFNADQNGGSLVFYSDNSDGVDAVADTGFPTAFYGTNIAVVEVGPEGNNGFTYTPTAGEPGFVVNASGPVTYYIVSDVPEPSALALGGLGICLGFGLRAAGRRSRP